MRRVAFTFGALATGCALAQRVFGLEWRDGTWLVLLGSVCASLGATGASTSMPRGPLPGTSWLVLLGAAETRAGAGRRVLWGIVGDSFFAAGVFAAVTIALAPDFHLVEMVLVSLAACHVYIAAASHFRWLLSSRFSAAVATPVVVALAFAGWTFGSWGLRTAIAACVVNGGAAVYLGGHGIGRMDLDLGVTREPWK